MIDIDFTVFYMVDWLYNKNMSSCNYILLLFFLKVIIFFLSIIFHIKKFM